MTTRENTIITVEKTEHGFTAYDKNESIFYSAPTPTVAVLGVQVMSAIDSTLPYDEDNEDERYQLWITLTESVVHALSGKPAAVPTTDS